MVQELTGVTSVKETEKLEWVASAFGGEASLQPSESGSFHHWGMALGGISETLWWGNRPVFIGGQIVFFLSCDRFTLAQQLLWLGVTSWGIFSGFTEGSLNPRESLTHPQSCQGGAGMTWMQLLLGWTYMMVISAWNQLPLGEMEEHEVEKAPRRCWQEQ